MKVRAIIRPNKVSEIRSIGSSTRPEGISETADIKSNACWLDLEEPILRAILANGADLSARSTDRAPQHDRTLRLYVERHRLAMDRAPPRDARAHDPRRTFES